MENTNLSIFNVNVPLLRFWIFAYLVPICLSFYCSVSSSLSMCLHYNPDDSTQIAKRTCSTLLSTAWCRYAYVSHIHNKCNTGVFGLRFVPHPGVHIVRMHKKCAICCCCFYRKLCLVGFHI